MAALNLSQTDKLLTERAKQDKKSNSNSVKYILICIVIVGLIAAVLIVIFYNSSTNKKVTANDIRKLRELLTVLYANSTNTFGDPMPLIPTVIRLVFHDCGGPGGPPTNIINSSINYNNRYNINTKSICDGCIDLSNTDNHGFLEIGAILPLEEVYIEHFSDIMSRSDFWVTSALIALEIASAQKRPDQDSAENIPNLGFWFGRVDCPLSYDANEG
eukprot:266779_1